MRDIWSLLTYSIWGMKVLHFLWVAVDSLAPLGFSPCFLEDFFFFWPPYIFFFPPISHAWVASMYSWYQVTSLEKRCGSSKDDTHHQAQENTSTPSCWAVEAPHHASLLSITEIKNKVLIACAHFLDSSFPPERSVKTTVQLCPRNTARQTCNMSGSGGSGAFGPWCSALLSSSPSLRVHPKWSPFLLKEYTVIPSHPTAPAPDVIRAGEVGEGSERRWSPGCVSERLCRPSWQFHKMKGTWGGQGKTERVQASFVYFLHLST